MIYTKRTVEEIKLFLQLYDDFDNSTSIGRIQNEIIKNAQLAEDYLIKNNKDDLSYCLSSDFYNNPFILEDEDEVTYLQFEKQIGGIIVYKPIYR